MSRRKMRVFVGIVWVVHTNVSGLVSIGTAKYRAFALDDAPVFVLTNVLLFLLGALVVGRIVEDMISRLGARPVLAGLRISLLFAAAVSGLALAMID